MTCSRTNGRPPSALRHTPCPDLTPLRVRGVLMASAAGGVTTSNVAERQEAGLLVLGRDSRLTVIQIESAVDGLFPLHFSDHIGR